MKQGLQVSYWYIEGIKEGRKCLDEWGTEGVSAQEQIDNIKETLKRFSASSPVGQMLRGELDFWKNQAKRK